jgi:hypothetical protein
MIWTFGVSWARRLIPVKLNPEKEVSCNCNIETKKRRYYKAQNLKDLP